MPAYALLVVFLNIAFLGKYALYDIETHSIPKIATLAYTIGSLLITTQEYLIQGILLCVIIYFITRTVYMGTGDRKIIFALTLQLGWFFGIILLGVVLTILFAKGKHNTKPVPLIPVILFVYIVNVFYMLINGKLT